jgi:hypothetical protein
MEHDSQPSGADSHAPASPEAAPGSSAGFLSAPPSTASRKLAWASAALLAAAVIGVTAWGVQAWQTNRALAGVESSLAGRPLSPPAAQAPANVAPVQAGNGQAEPVERSEVVGVVPAPADRLPPLVLPGQPVAAAVLRDLPEWVAAQVAPVQTSGASGDESAAPVPAPARPQRQRVEATPGKDRYGAVFARCPGPGESGAVECRRAVCDGAAKKTAACAPYLK